MTILSFFWWGNGYALDFSIFTTIMLFLIACAIMVFAVGFLGDDGGLAVGGAVGAIVLAVLTLLLTFPHEKEYHAYVPTTGVVERVDSRMLEQTEKYVVIFQGSAQEYGCEDTRCALIQPGDYLELRCIREWDYNGADGYDCKWGKRIEYTTQDDQIGG